MRIEVHYRPEMTFKLTVIQLDLLKIMARGHYDAHCKNFEAEFDRWTKTIEFGAPIHAPWRDIDTVCKILEPKWHLSGAKLKMVEEMATVFGAALRNSSDFSNRTVQHFGAKE